MFWCLHSQKTVVWMIIRIALIFGKSTGCGYEVYWYTLYHNEI